MLRQNWPAAARYLKLALSTAPLHDEVRLALSQTYRRFNRTPEADALLKTYRHHQDIRKQIGDVQSELSTTPRNVALYAKLGDLEMQLGDVTAAMEVMKTGLQINPKDTQLQKWLATVQIS